MCGAYKVLRAGAPPLRSRPRAPWSRASGTARRGPGKCGRGPRTEPGERESHLHLSTRAAAEDSSACGEAGRRRALDRLCAPSPGGRESRRPTGSPPKDRAASRYATSTRQDRGDLVPRATARGNTGSSARPLVQLSDPRCRGGNHVRPAQSTEAGIAIHPLSDKPRRRRPISPSELTVRVDPLAPDPTLP